MAWLRGRHGGVDRFLAPGGSGDYVAGIVSLIAPKYGWVSVMQEPNSLVMEAILLGAK